MSDDLVSDYLTHLKEHIEAPPSTINARKSAITQLNDWLPYGLVEATREGILAWKQHLAETGGRDDKGRSIATRSAYGDHIGAFFAWATDLPDCCQDVPVMLDGNPALGVPWPARPKSLPRPLAEEIIARLLGLPDPLRTVAILGGWQGLRRAEIAAAEREHMTESRLEIPHRKGGRAGSIPTHPWVWQELRDRPSGYLVRSTWSGRGVGPNTIDAWWRHAMDELGLTKVDKQGRKHRPVPHQLRHRFGTAVHAASGDLLVTRDALGHQSVSSTEGYALVAAPRVAAVMRDALPLPAASSQMSTGWDSAGA